MDTLFFFFPANLSTLYILNNDLFFKVLSLSISETGKSCLEIMKSYANFYLQLIYCKLSLAHIKANYETP